MNVRECKHCKEKFDISDKPTGWMANHSRWCDYNPKRKEYTDRLSGNIKNVELMNAARKRSGAFNQYEKARIEGREVPESPLKGRENLHQKGKKHTEASKEKIRQGALKSKHRRLKKGVVEYKGVILDSSWELALAKRLDELGIEWYRPEPLEWVDENGVAHNYFPDFYLPEYDKYLDPKNKHAILVQEPKLRVLLTQYSNIQIIDSLEGCKTFTI